MVEIHITGDPSRGFFCQIDDLGDISPAFETAAIEWLNGRGFKIVRRHPAETPGEFCDRVGICGQGFVRKTRDPRARGLYEADWGPSRRRILTIRSTPAFDHFCNPFYKPAEATTTP